MTELEVYQPRTAALAVPGAHDIDSWIAVASDVIKIAKVINDTPFVPDGLRGSEPAVAAAILAGRELGIGPMTALQHIHVIKGKPAQSAALMRALIQSAGHQIETVDISDTRAVVKGRRKGESVWEEAAFTADQAKRAGIDLGKYPQDKLYARATSRLARRKFADVIAGMPYSAEELEDGETDESAVAEAAASNGHAEPAKPPARTAQRRTRAAADRPAAAAPAAATAPTTGPATSAAAPSDALPPLPGEDEEPGPTQPGSSSAGQSRPPQETSPPSVSSPNSSGARASSGQVGIIQSHFKRLGFGDDERLQRLRTIAQIAGLDDLATSKDLTQDQARTVIDTLSRCRDRDRLIALLVGQDQDASGEPEPGDG